VLLQRRQRFLQELERAFADLLRPDYVPAAKGRDAGYDFESTSGRHVLEFKQGLSSARDLSAALFQLACTLAESPQIERATLIAQLPRMSSGRVQKEWSRLQSTLRPDLPQRLGIVAITSDGEVAIPDTDAELDRLRALARKIFGEHEETARPSDSSTGPWTPAMFEVWSVLLDAWLRREPALAIQEIVRRSGCSYPTVATTIARLKERGEIDRSRSRGATLSSVPRHSLGEILSLTDSLRPALRFVDGSGRHMEPQSLLRRLRDRAIPGMALGGVEAARHYTPRFDLNGLPRVDVTIHGGHSLAWIDEIDPGLQLIGVVGAASSTTTHQSHEPHTRPRDRSSVLVVHTLTRPEPQFDRTSSGMPYASPAETLLDLYDLRLTSQAEELITMMRERPRHV